MLFVIKRLFYKYFLVHATTTDYNVYFENVKLAGIQNENMKY